VLGKLEWMAKVSRTPTADNFILMTNLSRLRISFVQAFRFSRRPRQFPREWEERVLTDLNHIGVVN